MLQDPNAPLLSVQSVSKRFPSNRGRDRHMWDLLRRLARVPLPKREPQGEYFWPLQDVTFDLHPGETLGLIGENGSGKSTLLKVIGHILEPTTGEVVVRGRVAALLELGAGFHPDLTGRENIYLNGSILGLSRGEVDAYVDRIIEFADIGSFIDSPVKHYSSGMRVRLGFAIAVHVNPDLLLVDEVLAVGDEGFQHKCFQSFHDFCRRGGALLLVSHSLESMRDMCKRIVWLDAGRVRADGPANEVIARYLSHVHARERLQMQRAASHEAATGVGVGLMRSNGDGCGGPQTVEQLENPLRWGDGRVNIESVRILDKDGMPCFLVQTGEPITVEIGYRMCAELAAPPIVGVAFLRHDNVWCYGTNTEIDRISTGQLCSPEFQRGRVKFVIHSLPLLPGRYTLDVAFQDHNGGEHDYWRRCADLSVRSLVRDSGVARITHDWSFERFGVVADEPSPSHVEVR